MEMVTVIKYGMVCVGLLPRFLPPPRQQLLVFPQQQRNLHGQLLVLAQQPGDQQAEEIRRLNRRLDPRPVLDRSGRRALAWKVAGALLAGGGLWGPMTSPSRHQATARSSVIFFLAWNQMLPATRNSPRRREKTGS